MRKFLNTPKGKAYKERQKEYMKQWNKSEQAILSRKKYNESNKGKERYRKYELQPKRIMYKKQYVRSKSGKEFAKQRRLRYLNTIRGKLKRAEFIKQYEKQDHRRHRMRNMRREIVYSLGNECIRCHIKDIRVLELDHILNDGYIDRKRFNGDCTKMWRYYYKNIEEAKVKLQILCCNCNRIKTYEN